MKTWTLLAAVGLVLAAWTVPASAQDVVVIVNASNPIESLDADEARAYFLKSRRQWPHGERVRPIDRAGTPAERALFLEAVLGLSAAEVERHWIEEQYARAETPPTRAPDDATVLRLVETFGGAIGFVSAAALEAAGDGVRAVLTVNETSFTPAQTDRDFPPVVR